MLSNATTRWSIVSIIIRAIPSKHDRKSNRSILSTKQTYPVIFHRRIECFPFEPGCLLNDIEGTCLVYPNWIRVIWFLIFFFWSWEDIFHMEKSSGPSNNFNCHMKSFPWEPLNNNWAALFFFEFYVHLMCFGAGKSSWKGSNQLGFFMCWRGIKVCVCPLRICLAGVLKIFWSPKEELSRSATMYDQFFEQLSALMKREKAGSVQLVSSSSILYQMIRVSFYLLSLYFVLNLCIICIPRIRQ